MMRNIKTSSEAINPEFKQGHIWVAPMWADYDQKFKPRPVIVVGNSCANGALDVIACLITKQEKYKDEDFTFTIKSWREIGLRIPSFIRTNKIITIATNRISQEVVWQPKFNRYQPKGYIGKMEDDEFTNVLALCRDLF